jgi:hypothetical protein
MQRARVGKNNALIRQLPSKIPLYVLAVSSLAGDVVAHRLFAAFIVGNHTGGFYKCNKFDPKQNKEKDKGKVVNEVCGNGSCMLLIEVAQQAVHMSFLA